MELVNFYPNIAHQIKLNGWGQSCEESFYLRFYIVGYPPGCFIKAEDTYTKLWNIFNLFLSLKCTALVVIIQVLTSRGVPIAFR